MPSGWTHRSASPHIVDGAYEGAGVTISIDGRIAQELGVREAQVTAAAALLDEGATVPFIARYRKEATGNLDEVQIRAIEEKLLYFRELVARKQTILASIQDQAFSSSIDARLSGADDRAAQPKNA